MTRIGCSRQRRLLTLIIAVVTCVGAGSACRPRREPPAPARQEAGTANAPSAAPAPADASNEGRLDALSKAIEAQPDRPEAYLDRARARREDDFDAAIADLSRAAALAEESGGEALAAQALMDRAWRRLGRFERRNDHGALKDAREDARRAARLDPLAKEAWGWLPSIAPGARCEYFQLTDFLFGAGPGGYTLLSLLSNTVSAKPCRARFPSGCLKLANDAGGLRLELALGTWRTTHGIPGAPAYSGIVDWKGSERLSLFARMPEDAAARILATPERASVEARGVTLGMVIMGGGTQNVFKLGLSQDEPDLTLVHGDRRWPLRRVAQAAQGPER
jgi:hypothetical protein